MAINYTVRIYKNTMFGTFENVMNVPDENYDLTQHGTLRFNRIQVANPLLLSNLVLQGEYNYTHDEYDYLTITDENTGNRIASYFIDGIVGENNLLYLTITLDIITTHNIISKPITGTLIRKHDINPNESRFDYPTALQVEGVLYNKKLVSQINYTNNTVRLIESAVDLTAIAPSQTIISNDGQNIVIPKLPKPSHQTVYQVESRIDTHRDATGAYTLYDADEVSQAVLDTVRGLSGDGAISDSYSIPSEAVEIVKSQGEITRIKGRFLTKTSNLKGETYIDSPTPYTPRNEATRGLFKVGIQSMVTKDTLEFQGWDLKDSLTANGYIKFDLWCDPKPSGVPYCSPNQVETLHPNVTTSPLDLSTQDMKSVKGYQWLRNPLIYTTASGSRYAEIEAVMQKRQAVFERDNTLNQIEAQMMERRVQVSQGEFAYQTAQAQTLVDTVNGIMGANGVLGKVGMIVAGGANIATNAINNNFTEQINALQQMEYQQGKTLANMAYNNNINNINISSAINRNVPIEVKFSQSESLASYEQYNGFNVYVISPDYRTVIAKDREFSVYGYPVYEPVSNLVMKNNLRQNHTIFQFENPMLNMGGTIGDIVRQVLSGGIRILSKPYTVNNLLNNPKRT